jgi:uncharacterized protein YjiS (DUF1127 family)
MHMAPREQSRILGSSSFVGGLGGLVGDAVQTLLVWQERARQRRELAGLDGSLIKDLGIGRSEAYREAHKPFWRA